MTSRDQLFANIIRVAHSESPFFMDVTEVDATEFIQGGVTGGLGGIGTLNALQGAGPAVATSATAGALSSKVVTGRAGAVAGNLQYQETPTIRYIPLSGQALIAQIATPMSVTSIANLVTSDWELLSVMDFIFDRVTPNDIDFYAAIDAIAELNEYGALIIAAAKSDAARPEDPKPQVVSGTGITIQTASPPPQQVDSLVLYLQPDRPSLDPLNNSNVEETHCSGETPVSNKYYAEMSINDDIRKLWAKRNIMHLWIKLQRMYAGTQMGDILAKFGLKSTSPNTPQFIETFLGELDKKVSSFSSKELDDNFAKLPKKIDLRTSPVPTPRQQPASRASTKQLVSGRIENIPPSNQAPILTTHSALGVLKWTPPTYPSIEYVTPEAFKRINDRSNPNQPFYTLLTSEENSLCPNVNPSSPYCFFEDTRRNEPIAKCVSSWVERTPQDLHRIFSIQADVTNYNAMKEEDELGRLRRYLLIIVADSAPQNAFVSYTDRGRTFYIDGGDVISRKNFTLMQQIMTMQAVPSQTPPLTPTISVGG